LTSQRLPHTAGTTASIAGNLAITRDAAPSGTPKNRRRRRLLRSKLADAASPNRADYRILGCRDACRNECRNHSYTLRNYCACRKARETWAGAELVRPPVAGLTAGCCRFPNGSLSLGSPTLSGGQTKTSAAGAIAPRPVLPAKPRLRSPLRATGGRQLIGVVERAGLPHRSPRYCVRFVSRTENCRLPDLSGKTNAPTSFKKVR